MGRDFQLELINSDYEKTKKKASEALFIYKGKRFNADGDRKEQNKLGYKLTLKLAWYWGVYTTSLLIYSLSDFLWWSLREVYSRFKNCEENSTLINSPNMNQYESIARFVLNPIKSLAKYLPIDVPITATELYCNPTFIVEGSIVLFAYKVLKTSHDCVDDIDVAFSTEQLRVRVNDKLLRESLINRNFPSFYIDTPTISIHKIEDLGNHFRILLFLVENDKTYSFVKDRESVSPISENIEIVNDEDF